MASSEWKPARSGDWNDIKRWAKPLAAAYPIAFASWIQARTWLGEQYDYLKANPDVSSITGTCMLYRTGEGEIELWARPEVAFGAR